MRSGGGDQVILAVDAGSPIVSTAVASQGELLGERSRRSRRSSQDLVRMIDQLLSGAGLEPRDLTGIVALRGPGSFTGLRVGLATCLGLHQSLGVPATTLTTFEILASLAARENQVVLAAVESIRQSWLVQTFRTADLPEPLGQPRTISAHQLALEEVDQVIGFGLTALASPGGRDFRATILEPPPLAAPALALRHRQPSEWDPSGLVRPLYLQALAATPQSATAS